MAEYKQKEKKKHMKKPDQRVLQAHEGCMNNKPALMKDRIYGCFSCLRVFNTSQIKHWIPDEQGTAMCPYCHVDAVIGESTGVPMTYEFMKEMNRYWCNGEDIRSSIETEYIPKG